MPPHVGHIGICQAAELLCDELTVLVCSRDIESISGHLRASWMKKLLPLSNVLHLHRDIPQKPSDHPDFWNIWRSAIKEHHPEPINLVFGSEEYIVKLAEELGAEPVVLDPSRLAFPISGSDIRLNFAKNWDLIPDIVRPYFQKRVVIFGPESVGKSTLAMFLAGQFGTYYVPEYGRTYDRFKDDPEWRSSDFLKIAERHSAIRSAISPKSGPILIEDTDPLLTLAWEIMLTGVRSKELAAKIELADLYLVLDIDVPWTNDGTRYFGDIRRQEFMQLCIDTLREFGANYKVIQGNWTERERQAVEHVNAVIDSNH